MKAWEEEKGLMVVNVSDGLRWTKHALAIGWKSQRFFILNNLRKFISLRLTLKTVLAVQACQT